MFTYLQKWMLLRSIDKVCMKGNANFIGATKIVDDPTWSRHLPLKLKDQITKYGDPPLVGVELFLGAIAEKKWWQFWRSDGLYKRRKEHYRKLLETCETSTPRLVDSVLGKEYYMSTDDHEKHVRITGDGHVFSRLDSLLHELFFDKYKGWLSTLFVLIFAMFGSSYLVSFKTWTLSVIATASRWW